MCSDRHCISSINFCRFVIVESKGATFLAHLTKDGGSFCYVVAVVRYFFPCKSSL